MIDVALKRVSIAPIGFCLGPIATVIGALFFAAILSYVLITKTWQQYNTEQFLMIVIISAHATLNLNGVR